LRMHATENDRAIFNYIMLCCSTTTVRRRWSQEFRTRMIFVSPGSVFVRAQCNAVVRYVRAKCVPVCAKGCIVTVAFASLPWNCTRIALMLALIDRTMQQLSFSVSLLSPGNLYCNSLACNEGLHIVALI